MTEEEKLKKEEEESQLIIADKNTGEKLDITDLIPEEAEFNLNGKTYRLSRYSLQAKTHFIGKYGAKELLMQMASESSEIIYSEIAYYLLENENKKDFPTLEDFRLALINPQDQMDMIAAGTKAMGHARIKFMTEKERIAFEKEKKTGIKKK